VGPLAPADSDERNGDLNCQRDAEQDPRKAPTEISRLKSDHVLRCRLG